MLVNSSPDVLKDFQKFSLNFSIQYQVFFKISDLIILEINNSYTDVTPS